MSKTALLIIDVQLAIMDGAWRANEVMANIANLQRRARDAGAPVVFLQHNHHRFKPMMRGEPGWAIHPRVQPQSGDLVIEKTASDGFFNTTLQEDLGHLDVSDLVVTGAQTEFCVDATCRAALSRGFEVLLVEDAHTTGDAVVSAETTIRHHNYVLANLAHPQLSIVVAESAEVQFT